MQKRRQLISFTTFSIVLISMMLLSMMLLFPSFVMAEESQSTFVTGKEFNEKCIELANGAESIETVVKADVPINKDNTISEQGSPEIYIGYEASTKTIWLYSDKPVSLNEDSSEMFKGFTNLKKIDNFDVDSKNVKIIDHLFEDCKSLESIDLTNWNLSNVKEMEGTFSGCENLKEIKFPTPIDEETANKINEENAKEAQEENKEKPADVEINLLKPENITTGFFNCKNIEALDLSIMRSDNLKKVDNTFNGCEKLKSVKADKNLTFPAGEGVFTNTKELLGVNGTKWSEEHTNSEYARLDNYKQQGYFSNDKDATVKIEGDNIETTAFVRDDNKNAWKDDYFKGTIKVKDGFELESITAESNGQDFKDFKQSEENGSYVIEIDKVPQEGVLFKVMTKVKPNDAEKSNEGIVENKNDKNENTEVIQDVKEYKIATFVTGTEFNNKCSELAGGLDKIEHIERLQEPVDKNNTISTEDSTPIYIGYNAETKTIWWATEKEKPSLNKNSSSMFKDMVNLKSIDKDNKLDVKTDEVTDLSSAFENCHTIGTIDLSNLNMASVINTEKMFKNCESLTNIVFPEPISVDEANKNNKEYNTLAPINMAEMFAECKALTVIDCKILNPYQVQKADRVFSNCVQLKTIKTDKNAFLPVGEDIFENTPNLVGGNGTKWEKEHKNYVVAYVDDNTHKGYFTATRTIEESIGNSFENILLKTNATSGEPQFNDFDLKTQATTPSVSYRGHFSMVGSTSAVSDGTVLQATHNGHLRRLERFGIEITNSPILAEAYILVCVSDGVWYNASNGAGWVSKDDISLSNFIQKNVGITQSISGLKLTPTSTDFTNKYDLYYRAKIAYEGWPKWSKNGEMTGNTGVKYSAAEKANEVQVTHADSGEAYRRIEGFQAVVVPKYPSADVTFVNTKTNETQTVTLSEKGDTTSYSFAAGSGYLASGYSATWNGDSLSVTPTNGSTYSTTTNTTGSISFDSSNSNSTGSYTNNHYEYTVNITPRVPQYATTLSGSNVSATSGFSSTGATHGTKWTGKIQANTGYKLPTEISVSINNTASNNYSYDSSTGMITVSSSYVTGPIEITANGIIPGATFVSGNEFNTKAITLAGNANNILHIKRSTTCDDAYKVTANCVSINYSEYPIYMWFDSNTRTLNYWSEVDPYTNENASQMFYGLNEVLSIDLASVDTQKTTNMSQMFSAQKLKTIYGGSKFSTASVTNSSNMFTNCLALVGGNGTKWTNSNATSAYAKIDRPNNSGYFTLKALEFNTGEGAFADTTTWARRSVYDGNNLKNGKFDMTKIETPTREGYRFMGWYDEDGDALVDTTFIQETNLSGQAFNLLTQSTSEIIPAGDAIYEKQYYARWQEVSTIMITNKKTGELGDSTHLDEFAANIQSEGTFTGTITSPDNSRNGQTVNLTGNTNSPFSLKSGEQLIIADVPINSTYIVTKNSLNDYTGQLSYTAQATGTPVVSTVGTNQAISSGKKTLSGNKSDILVFTSRKGSLIPTGLLTNNSSYIVLIAFVFFGFVLYILYNRLYSKKRK